MSRVQMQHIYVDALIENINTMTEIVGLSSLLFHLGTHPKNVHQATSQSSHDVLSDSVAERRLHRGLWRTAC